jgi:hypothetical protein
VVATPAITTGTLNARKKTIQMAAIRPARWPGPVSRVRMRKAPRKNPVPKPAPATAVPVRKAAADPVSNAARVTTAPASRARQPANMAAGPLRPRNATVAAAPIPVIRKITRPPHNRSRELTPTSRALNSAIRRSCNYLAKPPSTPTARSSAATT